MVRVKNHSAFQVIFLTVFCLVISTLLIAISGQDQTAFFESKTAESAGQEGGNYWVQYLTASTTGAYSPLLTSDGNLYLVGSSTSNNNGGNDGWIMKISSETGQIQWQKSFGTNLWEYLQSPIETNDGNIVVAGAIDSGQSNDNNGLVVKLNPDGIILWQKQYGNSNMDEGIGTIIQLQDGGYIFTGGTRTNTYFDAWLVRLDANGNMLWEKAYGGQNSDTFGKIIETSDNGFLVSGFNSGVVGINGNSWLVKLNSQGDILWEHNYEDMSFGSFIELNDGSLLIGGTVTTDDRNDDLYLMKLTSDGSILWQKGYGTTGDESGASIQKIDENNFMVAGIIGDDSWLLKVDGNGDILWQKSYGEANRVDKLGTLLRAGNGDLYLYGWSDDSNENVPMIIKLDSNGNIDNCNISATANGTVVTLTPIRASFNPSSPNLNSTTQTADLTTINTQESNSFMCGGIPTSSINGRVTDDKGMPLPNTTISYGAGSLVTDSNGDYVITGLPAGTYTLVPSLSLYNFTPESLMVTVPPDGNNSDFVGTLIEFSEDQFLPVLLNP